MWHEILGHQSVRQIGANKLAKLKTLQLILRNLTNDIKE